MPLFDFVLSIKNSRISGFYQYFSPFLLKVFHKTQVMEYFYTADTLLFIIFSIEKRVQK